MNALIKFGFGVAGVAAGAVGCYFLKKSGNHVKVVQAVSKAGSAVTDVAVVATMATIDVGASAVEVAIAGAETVGSATKEAVGCVGYGVGRTARAVLDVTNKAGGSVSDNAFSKGVRKGFAAPDAEIVDAPVQGNLATA